MDSVTNITSFGDYEVWAGLLQVFILLGALLAGNVLRRKIGIIKKSLIPTALLGGLLLLILKSLPSFKNLIDQSIMETLTYHCLAIGFIALALKKGRDTSKSSVGVIVLTGIVQGSTYVIQAVFGLLVTIVLATTMGFFPAGGILLALGFGQGTGQALNYGKIFEMDYGFTGGTTFGLTIATVGFFVASVVGVVYMNMLRKKGRLTVAAEHEKFVEKLSDFTTDNDIPASDSVDKLSVNIGIVLSVYAFVYFIMQTINMNLIWGFNFLLGSICAMLTRVIFNRLQKVGVMHKDHTNDYLLDRIAGFTFDMMIIAGVAAIDLQQMSRMWWQILIICLLGAVVTFIYLRIITNRLYPDYKEEAFFSLFGTLTGTASNGVILLREIDPKFETPASTNLVLSGLPAIVFGGGLLALLGYCPKGFTESVISVIILAAAFILFNIILAVCIKKRNAKA